MGCGASSAAPVAPEAHVSSGENSHKLSRRPRDLPFNETHSEDGASGSKDIPGLLKLRSTPASRTIPKEKRGIGIQSAEGAQMGRRGSTFRSNSAQNLFAQAEPTLLAPPTKKSTTKPTISPQPSPSNPHSPNRRGHPPRTPPSTSRPASATGTTFGAFSLAPSPSGSGTFSPTSATPLHNIVVTHTGSRPSTASTVRGPNGIIIPVTVGGSRPTSGRSERPPSSRAPSSTGVGPGGLSRPPSAQAVAAAAAACAVACAAAATVRPPTSPLPETRHLRLPRHVQTLFDAIYRTVVSFRPKDPLEDIIFFAGEITQCILGLDPPRLEDEGEIYEVVGEVLLRIVVDTVREAEEFPKRLLAFCADSVPAVDLPLAVLEAHRNPIDWLELTIK